MEDFNNLPYDATYGWFANEDFVTYEPRKDRTLAGFYAALREEEKRGIGHPCNDFFKTLKPPSFMVQGGTKLTQTNVYPTNFANRQPFVTSSFADAQSQSLNSSIQAKAGRGGMNATPSLFTHAAVNMQAVAPTTSVLSSYSVNNPMSNFTSSQTNMSPFMNNMRNNHSVIAGGMIPQQATTFAYSHSNPYEYFRERQAEMTMSEEDQNVMSTPATMFGSAASPASLAAPQNHQQQSQGMPSPPSLSVQQQQSIEPPPVPTYPDHFKWKVIRKANTYLVDQKIRRDKDKGDEPFKWDDFPEALIKMTDLEQEIKAEIYAKERIERYSSYWRYAFAGLQALKFDVKEISDEVEDTLNSQKEDYINEYYSSQIPPPTGSERTWTHIHRMFSQFLQKSLTHETPRLRKCYSRAQIECTDFFDFLHKFGRNLMLPEEELENKGSRQEDKKNRTNTLSLLHGGDDGKQLGMESYRQIYETMPHLPSFDELSLKLRRKREVANWQCMGANPNGISDMKNVINQNLFGQSSIGEIPGQHSSSIGIPHEVSRQDFRQPSPRRLPIYDEARTPDNKQKDVTYPKSPAEKHTEPVPSLKSQLENIEQDNKSMEEPDTAGIPPVEASLLEHKNEIRETPEHTKSNSGVNSSGASPATESQKQQGTENTWEVAPVHSDCE